MIIDKNIREEDITYDRYHNIDSIDSENSPSRRNSNPFLHRPRTLFQERDLHAGRNSTQQDSNPNVSSISSNIHNPTSSQENHENLVETEKGSHTEQFSTEDANDKADKKLTSRNSKLKAPKSNGYYKKTRKQINSNDASSESELEPSGLQEKPERKSHVKTKKSKIPKELEFLLSSNDFHGFLSDDSDTDRRLIRSKKKVNEMNDTKISNSKIKSSVPSPSKQIKNIAKENSISSSEEKGKTTKARSLKQQDVSSSATDNEDIFKLPLPPRPQGKTKNVPKERLPSQNTKETSKININHEITENDSELYLKNWTPKLKGKKLLFEGELLNMK